MYCNPTASVIVYTPSEIAEVPPPPIMNLLKEILANEVYPALGCTEPVSCAYAAALAAAELGEPVQRLTLRIDPSTYKNGAAVTVPHSGGAKGNLVAAALGAALARPESKLQLLQNVTDDIRARGQWLCQDDRCRLECDIDRKGFYVEVEVAGESHSARSILSGGHTRVERLERDGRTVLQEAADADSSEELAYRAQLGRMTFSDVLALAARLDAEDQAYLRRGVEMNLAISEWGYDVGGTAFQLRRIAEQGHLAEDLFFRAKFRVASAIDARMSGVAQPVMTSGGSGNQGIVAILTPYIAGREMGVPAERIIESIAAAHAVNAYVKAFVGELSVVCGCALAAGIAAAVAIVYQQAGADVPRMNLAVSGIIGDLGGLICDGAKPSCSMKAVSGVDAALRAALMALQGYGLPAGEGVVGRTAEESIRNLARLGLEGMFSVDPTVLKIIQERGTRSGLG
jgi:L-cysteine desulfidase